MGYFKNGSLSESEWLRYMRKDEYPFIIDPKKGYIVASNNNFASS